VVWVSIAGVVFVLAQSPAAAAVTTAAIQPAKAAAALPSGQLHFGLANDSADLGWMTSSGVPWRYRYQYLAGGVNTANRWQN
jgi:hypothetical protein